MWPLELGLGTHNPRFVVWPLELGLGTFHPRFVVWPLELGLGTHRLAIHGLLICWGILYGFLLWHLAPPPMY